MYVCWRVLNVQGPEDNLWESLPLSCAFHPRAQLIKHGSLWAILHVPSQLAIPKEASRVSLLESDTFRKHGSLAGSEWAVYSHPLSQAERQCILTILLRGTELRDRWGFNSQIAEITYACSILLTFGLEMGISKISALGTH